MSPPGRPRGEYRKAQPEGTLASTWHAESSGPVDPSWPWLVADIGGTNARFGWVDDATTGVQHVQRLAVAEHGGPTQAVQAYLARLAAQQGGTLAPPRWAAFAMAGAVQQDAVRLTNSAWVFARQQVSAELGLKGLLVLNDFEALALSLPRLRPTQLRYVGDAPAHAEGPRRVLAVIGPGTGLGVAGVMQSAQGWLALPGEGGHATLAAANALEDALLQAVRRQYAHVSAERLLSGIGLPVLHAALAAVRGETVPTLWPEDIVQRGLGPDDALARQTLELFCALLGGFAGNVALTLGARGGVYIGGGIVPRLGDFFFQSPFRERFESKGRFSPYLKAIPTAVITDTLAALTGAALAIEQQVG